MEDKILLAHSAKKATLHRCYVPAQSYNLHVANVTRLGLITADNLLKWYTGPEVRKSAMRRVVELACIFHDLGKLHPIFQDLMHGVTGAFNINHVDAGVMVMRNAYDATGNRIFLYAAILIESHHIGILNGDDNRGYRQLQTVKKGSTYLRDTRTFGEAYGSRFDIHKYYPHIDLNERICDHFDKLLQVLLKQHLSVVKDSDIRTNEKTFFVESDRIPFLQDFSPLELRFMGACLYFSDHTDTAIADGGYGIDENQKKFLLNPAHRGELLNKYVKLVEDNARKFNRDGTISKTKKRSKRNKVRHMLYQDCIKKLKKSHFYLNDGYVGTGKTLANIALALQIAARYGLRGIHIVAPYTSIVSQIASELVDGNDNIFYSPILDDDERHFKNLIVAEHHHRNEYRDQIVKSYNVTWTSPIVCTTSVQLVESIASNKTVQTKKLINLPGRVIVQDEFDNSMPYWEWAIFSNWIKELADNWSCYFVLSSGSTAKLWEIELLNAASIKPVSVIGKETRKLMREMEKQRIKYKHIGTKTLESFIGIKQHFNMNTMPEFEEGEVDKCKGPVCITINTLQNWAIVVHMLSLKYGKKNVMSLSTAFSTERQKAIIKEVENRLKDKSDDWFFVTTSSAESGVNFSFKNGFREANSVKSVIQPGGRINRHGISRSGTLFVFDFAEHQWLTDNPQFRESINILHQLFEEKGSNISPDDCTAAIDRELRSIANADMQVRINRVQSAEKHLEMRVIRDEMKVIEDQSVTVLCDADIFLQLAWGDIADKKVSEIYKELMQKSFTVFWAKMTRPEFQTIALSHVVDIDHFEQEKMNKFDGENIMIWGGGYDEELLGYMSEILYQQNMIREFNIPLVVRGNMCADPVRRHFWQRLGISQPLVVL